ncbi:MAG: DNA recombination protein RmuC [Clostridia bacterium]|nr:DNA recombination protein RmuC [Clostridia bacterium]
MNETILIVILVLLAITLVANAIILLLVFKKRNEKTTFDTKELEEKMSTTLDSTAKGIKDSFMMTNEATTKALMVGLNSTNEQVVNNVKELSRNNEIRLQEMKQELQMGLKDMKGELTTSLNKVREDNTAQLEKIRGTVDEKLTKTLDEKFQVSFKSVLDSLDNVYKNLGELKTLDTGLNELTKMLSNTKTRGNWGELSLETILSDILTPAQYEKQSKMGRRVQEDKIVDFAIVLPGTKEDKVYLPIDSKFPVTDFTRMKDALAEGNTVEYQNAKKALGARIKHEAISIKDKYIAPPATTDFAVMFLPVESLYAEVLSIEGLVEQIQSSYRVMIAGPSNITAFLNSLRLGFRTLKIQKESRQIYEVLEQFRKSFNTFVGDLEKAQDQLGRAQKTIDDARKRTFTIQQRLNKAEGLEPPAGDEPLSIPPVIS